MARRNLYLTNCPVEEALEKYLEALKGLLVPRYEEIPVPEAAGRVNRAAVYARCCSPLYNAAAMDGIAVTAAATLGARESAPLTLVRGKDFQVVNTGDPVRPPYDAVIMAEDTIEIDEDRVRILAPAAGWQHIRPMGEDIVSGEMLLPGKQRIRPIDIGVLLSGGISRVEVYRAPRIAIYPTGYEIIEAAETPGEANIIESNAWMLKALAARDGGRGRRFPVIPDNKELLREAVLKALTRYDMVLINAGSSAGTEDFTAPVLGDLGKILVHGVAMKPGKPVVLAVVQGKPVIGIPGYPVSACLAYENFAAPVIRILSGRQARREEIVEAALAKRLVSSLKYREYVRVKIGKVDGRLVASPLARGAGAAMSLARADGFCIIDQNREGIEAGETARVKLYRSLDDIERTVVSIGSHDLILDILADLMAGAGNACLASSHVGSMAGLMALLRGESHIAPIHLLDEDSGEYNISYLKQIFPRQPMALIKGVGRVQGLIVKKGNPRGIKMMADLLRCRYINRQRGAGTRLLLDYRLKLEGIPPDRIDGYDREAVTHMAVAAAIQSGSADAGMGISAAAAALDLGFIPLGDEEYDFALPPRFLEFPPVRIFCEVLRSPEFHRRLAETGGYTWNRCGEVVLFDGDH
jgi:putative molybdopterin biosynthesis protein